MSQQSQIDRFFKPTKVIVRSDLSKNMSDLPKDKCNITPTKKFKLSLIKNPSPVSSSRIKKEIQEQVPKLEGQVINISSDDDDFCSPKGLDTNKPNFKSPQCTTADNGDNSDSSDATISYSLTPKSTSSPQTPVKTPRAIVSPKSSPGSMGKFYSPVKKKVVTKRTPVKRKLEPDFLSTKSPKVTTVTEPDNYARDDKTKALINIITKCLGKESLKRLLSEECQMLLDSCLAVQQPGMHVVCRLYWRKAGWFRTNQLKAIINKQQQMDDPSFHLMLQSLIANGLLVRGSVDLNEGNLTFDELTKILKSDELKQICKELKLKVQSKSGAIDALKLYCRQPSIRNFFKGDQQKNDNRLLRMMSQQAGPCYKLSDFARTTFEKLYILMYLGINYNIIREKKLEVAILYDINKIETYPIDENTELDDASVVFEDMEQFDRYYTAHCIYEDFLERTSLKEKCDIVKRVYDLYKEISDSDMLCYKALPPWLRRYTPANLYVKILETGVTDLKKNKTKEFNKLAVDILTTLIDQTAFRQHKKAEWYSEKALILYNLEQFDEAAKVVLEGLNSNLPVHAKDALRPRIPKLCSKASDWLSSQLMQHESDEDTLENSLPAEHVFKLPMDRTTQRGKVKFETRLDSARVVQDAEQYCISYYIEKGEFTHGGHWEGSIVNTLFFLLFWDCIYAKPRGVAGIFLSRYQRYPLDMFCDSFYTNRQKAIDDRLAALEAGTTDDMLETITEKWNSREPCELSEINRSIGLESVRAVARCLRPAAAAALCRRLAGAYRHAHAGFPDLTLWNAHTGKIRFIEVKTDTDKPSMKQIQWMHYLQQHGIETSFCYVGANTKRCKARAS